MQKREHYFYEKPILRNKNQIFIENLLKKYKDHPADEELKKKIWNELQKEKYLGNLDIPFKVVLRKDIEGNYPPYIEVILDTKV